MLASLARLYLSKKKVMIVGVTGSFGKTSTKDAIAFLLETKFTIAKSKKSLNTEFGLPLAIFQLSSGFSNPLKWLGVLFFAVFEALFGKPHYDKLILEYGADKPGDMDYLLGIVKPDIAVLTAIAPVHLAEGQFENIEMIRDEKQKLLFAVEKGTVILNGDMEYAKDIILKLKVRPEMFGTAEGNSISAKNIISDLKGISADIVYGWKVLPFHSMLLGSQHMNIFLAALLVGKACGIEIEEGIRILQMFTLPPGRFSVIPGKNGSTLIDSAYNASPITMKAALKTLKELPAKRKICVLGNMNELGQKAVELHRGLSDDIIGTCDLLFTVGNLMKETADAVLKKSFPESNMKILNTSEEAGMEVSKILQEGDVVLFKGSQNKVRLEASVKACMKNPEDAEKLLVRQEKEWSKR